MQIISKWNDLLEIPDPIFNGKNKNKKLIYHLFYHDSWVSVIWAKQKGSRQHYKFSYYLLEKKKEDLVFHVNYLLGKQFTWNNKPLFD